MSKFSKGGLGSSHPLVKALQLIEIKYK